MTPACLEHGCAKIPKRSGIHDPQDPNSEILMDLGSSISGFVVRAWDLESCMFILSRDPDGSRTLLFTLPGDPGNLGSWLFTFSGDLGLMDPAILPS